ncbi:MAG: hypothetical protein JKP92_08780 [Alphaproteobacteria bacterium]|jgi:NADH dehydrogenase [ubiquinone] 1 alpha subcomplex assembly factor 5|nr:hypothetical protein [Alphaproteobacteria bacterium]
MDTDFLTRWAAARLAERLDDVTRDFPLALATGPGFASPKVGRLLTLGREVAARATALPFRRLGAIVSPLTLNVSFTEARRALAPGGLYLAALLGADTRPAVPGLPEAADIAAALPRAGFASPVVDVERVRVAYADAGRFAQDLAELGLPPPPCAGPLEAVFAVVFCSGWAGLRSARSVTLTTGADEAEAIL